jgi:hypothetical protein
MQTYRVQFSTPGFNHLTGCWMRTQATDPLDAALSILRRNHVLLARCVGKTMIAHVAGPKTPVYPNGMPMMTHGYTIKVGEEVAHA